MNNKTTLGNRIYKALKKFFTHDLWVPCRYIHNYFFCLKYPFWKAYNVWTGKFCGYSFTEYDAIPKGGQIAFGKQLSEDIKKAFKEDKKDNPELTGRSALWFYQIKEKYGTLCLYASATSRILDVLSKYESLSSHYCIVCGRPSEYVTSGWIEYYCENCFFDYLINNHTFQTNSEIFDYLEAHQIKDNGTSDNKQNPEDTLMQKGD